MLTCFSALLFLLDVYVKRQTVTVADAKKMISMTPTARVASVANDSRNQKLTTTTKGLLELYERFLAITCASEETLIELFSNEEQKKRLRAEQSHFGDLVFDSLQSIGEGNRFYRRLIV
jgi:hypothetical protein